VNTDLLIPQNTLIPQLYDHTQIQTTRLEYKFLFPARIDTLHHYSARFHILQLHRNVGIEFVWITDGALQLRFLNANA
jgi:hypothetical protein